MNLLCTQDTLTVGPELKAIISELVVHIRFPYIGA